MNDTKPSLLRKPAGVLQRHARIVALSCVAGLLAGLVLAAFLPTSYEGVGIVRMGQVALSSVPADVRLVELPSQAAARVKLPSFLAGTQLGETAAAGKDVAGRVVARPVRDTNLLEIRYRAGTEEAARRGVQVVYEHLRQRHEELARPARQRLAEQLQAVQALRSQAEARRTEMLQKVGPIPAAAAVVQLAFTGEQGDLQQRELALRAALQEPGTQPTTLTEAIMVDQRTRSPKLIMLGVLGLAAGLALGAALAVRRERSSARAAATPA